MLRTPVAGHSRWLAYAAGTWALCFAAPHIWWALGSSVGFPGGPASHRVLMDSWWRYLYDLLVVALSILGAVVAFTLRAPESNRFEVPFRKLAWTAAALLTLRGVAGIVADGAGDLIWSPAFLAGGLLFTGVAYASRRSA